MIAVKPRIPPTTPPTTVDVLALLLVIVDEALLEDPSGLPVVDCTGVAGVGDDKVDDNVGIDAVEVDDDAVVDALELGQWVNVSLFSDT